MLALILSLRSAVRSFVNLDRVSVERQDEGGLDIRVSTSVGAW